VTHRDRKLAEVMVERFGDPLGDANALYARKELRRTG
jgi:hypothetical protein